MSLFLDLFQQCFLLVRGLLPISKSELIQRLELIDLHVQILSLFVSHISFE